MAVDAGWVDDYAAAATMDLLVSYFLLSLLLLLLLLLLPLALEISEFFDQFQICFRGQ